MIKKLEIIGPYTEDHEGPFAWILGYPKKCLVHSVVEGVAFITADGHAKPFLTRVFFIRNAREVPAAREVWLPEFENGTLFGVPMNTKEKAEVIREANGCVRLIHFREVIDAAREVG